jgi:hypothetical protein
VSTVISPSWPWCVKPRPPYTNPATGEVFALPCNNWRKCKPCAMRRRWKLIRDLGLRSIPWQTEITLTVADPHGDPTLENIRFQAAALRKLVARLDYQRRVRGLSEFGIFWVRERIPRLHIHALTTIPRIRQAELSKLAAKSGFGPVVHIKKVHQYSVDYVTKDLACTKSEPRGNWKTGTRRCGFRPPQGFVRPTSLRKTTARTRTPKVHVVLGTTPRSGK